MSTKLHPVNLLLFLAAVLLWGTPVLAHESSPTVPSVTQEQEGQIGISDETEVKTRLIKRVNPRYPDEAKKEGIAGKVLCKVRADENGRVAEVKIQESPHDLLSSAAVDALVQWVYEPVEKDGKPVSFWLTVTINFQLK